jgi:hypothetical protein
MGKGEAGLGNLRHGRLNIQEVRIAGRGLIIYLYTSHDEVQPFLGPGTQLDPSLAKVFGPGPLQVPQIVGVINDSAAVSIFIINPDPEVTLRRLHPCCNRLSLPPAEKEKTPLGNGVQKISPSL